MSLLAPILEPAAGRKPLVGLDIRITLVGLAYAHPFSSLLSLLSDWISEKPAGGRLSKQNLPLISESELSMPC